MKISMTRPFLLALIPLALTVQTCKKDKAEKASADDQLKAAAAKCPRVAALKEHKAEALYNVITYAKIKWKVGEPEVSVDGPLCDAQFGGLQGITISGSIDLYVADTWGFTIRKISPDGIVSTVAGRGIQGYVDGPARSAQFGNPIAIAVDKHENIYVGDHAEGLDQFGIQRNFGRIRKITPAGTVTTLPFFPEKLNAARYMSFPTSFTIGPDGAIYAADANSIWRVDADGNGSLYAGGDHWDEEGRKEDVHFEEIHDLQFGPNGSLYVADYHLLREISTDGYVRTVAGHIDTTITGGNIRDGQGKKAEFERVYAIAFDSDGTIFAGDNGCIRKISKDGYVSTIAGKPFYFEYHDAVGRDARFKGIHDLAISGDYLYIADAFTKVLRRMKIK